MFCIMCIGLFLPLAGFIFLMASSSFIGRKAAGIIASTTVLIAFFCFAYLLTNYVQNNIPRETVVLYNWIPVAGLYTDFTLRLDHLSLLMTLLITGIGFLIHVYSIGYMDHEEDYARYFACMNFFIFAMLLLVLAGNLLVMFVGWEGVGLASYLLIGFYYTRPAAAQAAVKAFVVNRIGDLGLLMGLLLTYKTFGTADLDEVARLAQQGFAVGAPLITILTLLYFIGAMGKSAQIPLQTWLPDAMEGPTPVSALIHAATMVTAGVYLVVRMHGVFMLAPDTLHIIGFIGGATALFAAICAIGQTDLKRVLAYSTVSQLGLMFLACGIGAFYAAMFHLTTHAFVKALLFLSAGNVVHMMRGTTDMEKMGGLSKKFTKTHWLFLIGVLAMSGIPPLAAFFSKDLILEEEFLAGFKVLFIVGVLTSLLTGFYLMRAYCLTFLGAPRIDEKIFKVIREAPTVMLVPVSILAFLAIVGGYLGFAIGKTPILESFLEEVGITMAEKEFSHDLFYSPETWLSIAIAVISVSSAAILYTKFYDRLGANLTLLRKSLYIDELYDAIFVRPLKALARFIDNFAEPEIFDDSISFATNSAQKAAVILQKVQSGQIRSYVAWMAVGMVLLILYILL